MRFDECIRQAAAAGKISETRADEALQVYEDWFENEKLANGGDETLADMRATQRAGEILVKRSRASRSSKIQDIKTAGRIWHEIQQSKRPDNYLKDLQMRLHFAQERLVRQGSSFFAKNLEAARPRAAGIIHPIKHLDDVIHASFGVNRGQSAKELADEMSNLVRFYEQQANLRGASIPAHKQGRLPQSQTRKKLVHWIMKRHGGDTPKARKAWVEMMYEAIDWDQQLDKNGELIPEKHRRGALYNAFNTINTNGTVDIDPSIPRVESLLTTRMERATYFYYKSPEDWLKMQNLFGQGNIYQEMTSLIETMSRDVALLEVLGSNPRGTAEFARQAARKRAGDLAKEYKATGKGPFKKPERLQSQTDKIAKEFEDSYEIFTHNVAMGEESPRAVALATARTLVGTAVLTKAFVSNLGDLGSVMYFGGVHKIPPVQAAMGVLGEMARMPFDSGGARRKWFIESGAGFASAQQPMLAATRFLGTMDGHSVAQRIGDIIFRLTWLTPLTQGTKWTWHDEMAASFANMRGLEWGQIPHDMRVPMEHWGITAEDWDIFRKQPVHVHEGKEYLLPISMFKNEALDPEFRANISNKFEDYISYTSDLVSPETNLRVQRAIGQHLPRDTAVGQVAQMLNQLKSFPATLLMVHQRHFMEILDGNMPTRLGRYAHWAAGLTMGGAIILQLKALAAGQDPYDVDTKEFWARAALQGGSLGFLGDAMFSNVGKYVMGGLIQALGGPTPQFYSDVRDISIGNMLDYVEGKDTKIGREMVDMLRHYAPIPWQYQLIIERKMFEELMRASDPAAYNRLQQAQRFREQTYGQKSWWGPGDRNPTRAPDFSQSIPDIFKGQ